MPRRRRFPCTRAANPRMYRGLTAKTPGCVAFSLPVQRRNLRISEDSSVFPIPPQPAQRAADKEWRFRARAASGPRLPSCSRDGFRHGITDYPGRKGPICDGRRALRRRAGPSATDKAALLPPTCSDGPTLDAPDCVADHDPRKNRADAERKLRASRCSAGSRSARRPGLRFGLPLTPESGGPSRHPAARYALTVDTRPPPSRVPKCPTKC